MNNKRKRKKNNKKRKDVKKLDLSYLPEEMQNDIAIWGNNLMLSYKVQCTFIIRFSNATC
jgi:hypothetical protein